MELTIVDTFNFFFRNFYGLPPLRSRDGFPTGMIQGVVNFIKKLPSYSSDYVVFTLDSDSKKGFRAQLYPEYKQNRPPIPEDLERQIPVAIELLKKMGFQLLEKEGFESDDLIASLVRLARQQGIKVKIVSTDKDLCQLIEGDEVVLFDPFKGEVLDEKGCIKKYGVPPSQFVDYQALVGDSSDNVPGVRGIGPKRARELVNRFGSLEGIYAHLEQLPTGIRKKLEEGRESAFLSRELVRLRGDALGEVEWEKFKYPSNPFSKVKEELERLGIREVLKRVGIAEGGKLEFNLTLLSAEEALRRVSGWSGPVVVEWEGKSLGFGKGGEFYRVDSPTLKLLETVIAKGVVGFGIKKSYPLFAPLLPFKPAADVEILGWILDPDGSHSLPSLAKRHLGIPLSKSAKLGERLEVIARLFPLLSQKLWESVKGELEGVEYPLSPLLYRMEQAGVEVDLSTLYRLGKRVEAQIKKLEEEVFKIAGEEINLNSTKQLQYLLFEKLKLPPQKRTKTGYSTDEVVLTKLSKLHPVPAKILEYRRLVKLENTYITPLIKYALSSRDRRVRTTFIQTGTATGRLASRNPNLQNIPTDRELNIRNAFTSRYFLVSFDYSQIELRLLAHYSRDPYLMEAFQKGRDIHLETAKKLFPEAPEAHRGVAKSINFGLIYGMGPKKLADTIGVSTSKAKKFIETYFQNFPTIKEFLEKVRAEARERGYIETLLGRRRFFNFSQATGELLARLEREAVNSIFQGGAADIIKKSMVEGEKRLPSTFKLPPLSSPSHFSPLRLKNRPKRYLPLLQIHDELLFETPTLWEVIGYKRLMEGVVRLEVPLKVEVKIGKRWGDLTEVPDHYLDYLEKLARSATFSQRRRLILKYRRERLRKRREKHKVYPSSDPIFQLGAQILKGIKPILARRWIGITLSPTVGEDLLPMVYLRLPRHPKLEVTLTEVMIGVIGVR